MSAAFLEFDFSAPVPADRASHMDVAVLVGWLSGKGWQTGKALCARLGWSERKLRSVANLSDGEVLSWPGSKGYCLTVDADPEDVNHGIAAMRAQAGEMHRRARMIEAAAVKFFAGQPPQTTTP
jgi:hypothetical protein